MSPTRRKRPAPPPPPSTYGYRARLVSLEPTTVTTITFPNTLYSQAHDEAQRRGWSFAEVVRQALEAFLAKERAR